MARRRSDGGGGTSGGVLVPGGASATPVTPRSGEARLARSDEPGRHGRRPVVGSDGPGRCGDAEPEAPGSGEPGGLRERKQARTRAELKAAADRLFDRRGFDAVTVEDICAEVEISPRTFFRYFHNKDEIVFEGIRPRLAQMVDAFADRPLSEDAYEALSQALLAVAGDPDYQHELRWVHRQISSSPELLGASLQHYRVWEDRLVDLVVARSPGTYSQAAARLLTAVAFGALSATLEEWARHPDEPLKPQLQAALSAVRHGVQGIAGLGSSRG